MTQRQKPGARQHSPANRLGLDYRAVPPRKLSGPVIDAHTHIHHIDHAPLFFEVAEAYGVERVLSMSPVQQVEPLRRAYADRISFIAVPRWHEFALTPAFRRQWLDDLREFRQHGARLCKFWSAPPLRGELGLTLEHDFFQPVIQQALELGYEFMVHIGDPRLWWRPGGRYADTTRFGTRRDQYEQLAWFLETVAPRRVIGAHLAGSVEAPRFLQSLLDRYQHLWLDCSATKWIVREVARRPAAARELIIRNHERILFGTDLVTESGYDFDHYASRYWAHLKLWETPYRGESPIADPDAAKPPQLCGIDLPAEILRSLYRDNAARFGL
ncbi:MAG: amidohydrolase [Planctomycetes bacterium]|nr:amidohydrolase [Planctomycetota bacterium]